MIGNESGNKKKTFLFHSKKMRTETKLESPGYP